MRILSVVVALATAHLTWAQYSGFNYGSTFTSGAAKQQADFEAEFRAAAGLKGPPATFNSARLYTMVQAGTANDPTSAIPAGIATRTSLLFGLWASAGDAAFANELLALKRAVEQYGSSLGGLVAGISVGSEDLYRNSPTGQANGEYSGADPAKVVDYIRQVREAIAGTALSGVPVGHVDTWTEWVNVGRNQAVINACDFIGFDAYPYFETTAAQGNAIEQNKALFDSAMAATKAAVGGKPVWVTETGFPVSGKTSGQAVPSVENARRFWEQVGCSVVGKMNVWWYTVQDAAPTTPNPSFGILSSDGTQLYDLSCTNVATTQASSSPAAPQSSVSQPTLSSPSPSGGNAGAPSTTSTSAPSIGGGSPGASSPPGGGSSQFTIQTETSLRTQTTSTGTGSGSTSTTTSATSSPNAPGNGAADVKTGSAAGAAFAALLGAVLVF